jgi:hypothetical protein
MSTVARKLEHLLSKYQQRFNQYDFDFLVHMIALVSKDHSLSNKQEAYLETLIKKIEVWEKLEYFRQTHQ